MSGRGRGHGHRHFPPNRQITTLRRQVQILSQELRDANTGRFSKKTSCIHLPPWEQYAKIFRTVHIQHGSTTAATFWCVINDVYASVVLTIYMEFNIVNKVNGDSEWAHPAQ